MPTDAELRTLFHESAVGSPTIDTAAVIRRSKRRRIPQQLGAGSVLTLAAAGIGVASISGLQSFMPRSASDLAGDAPTAVSEGTPFGAESQAGSDAARGPACVSDESSAPVAAELSLTATLPASVAAGQPVAGEITLTNIGDDAIAATLVGARIGVTGAASAVEWHSDSSAAGSLVRLEPGESTSLGFTFDAIDCSADGSPLTPGDYRVSTFVDLVPGESAVAPVRGFTDDDALEVVGSEASVITVR